MLFQSVFQRPPSVAEPLFVELEAKKDANAGDRKPKLPARCRTALEEFTDEKSASLTATSQAGGQNLFVRLALRDSAGDVKGSWCLWASVDADTDAKRKSAKERINGFSPLPNFVFSDGSAFHVVWILEKFEPSVPKLKARLRGIQKVLHGDQRAGEVWGGIRMPGSVNWKLFNPEQELPLCVIKAGPKDPSSMIRHALEDFPQDDKEHIKSEIEALKGYREVFSRYFGAQEGDLWHVKCIFHEDDGAALEIHADKGFYTCTECGRNGTAMDLYISQEGVSQRDAYKTLGHLKNQKALIDLLELVLRRRCVPLYWDGGAIVVAKKKAQGGLGSFIELKTGNKASIEESLAVLFGGSPGRITMDAVADNVDMTAINSGLREAALQLGQVIPNRESIKLLGQGIHFEKGLDGEPSVLMVDGGRMHRWDGAWQKVDTAMYKSYWVVSHGSDDPRAWYPWKQPSRVNETLKEAFQFRLDVLKEGWVLNGDDYTWLALYSLYAPVWNMFGFPIHMQISAPSQSGKSALTEGFFAGHQPEAVQMVCGTQYITNASAAYVSQVFDRWRLPVVFDEALDYDDFRVKGLIELVRSMENGDAQIRRGTADGRRGKVYSVAFPTIWSSIKVPDEIQDQNRRLHIEIPKIGEDTDDPDQKQPPSPWQKILERWDRTTCERQARIGVEAMLASEKEILARFVELRSDLSRIAGGSYRMAYRMLPLLTIASLCGVDAQALMGRMTAKVKIIEDQTRESAPHELLRQAILHHPIKVPGDYQDTTLASQMRAGNMFNVPSAGVYYFPRENQIGIMVGRFVGHWNPYRWTANNLSRQLRNIPGWIRNGTKWCNGETVRIHLLDAGKLQGKQHAPGAAVQEPAVLGTDEMEF